MTGPREKTILIVEDDRDAAATVRIVLEGYPTITAGEADEALSRVRAERPDVLLLDVMMLAGTEGFLDKPTFPQGLLAEVAPVLGQADAEGDRSQGN